MSQYYAIRVKGYLDPSWSDWFDPLSIAHEDNGETVLSGNLPDQASLHGVLRKIRDLGIALVSVNPVEISLGSSEGEAQEL